MTDQHDEICPDKLDQDHANREVIANLDRQFAKEVHDKLQPLSMAERVKLYNALAPATENLLSEARRLALEDNIRECASNHFGALQSSLRFLPGGDWEFDYLAKLDIGMGLYMVDPANPRAPDNKPFVYTPDLRRRGHNSRWMLSCDEINAPVSAPFHQPQLADQSQHILDAIAARISDSILAAYPDTKCKVGPTVRQIMPHPVAYFACPNPITHTVRFDVMIHPANIPATEP